jgi:hypothetical protein
MAASGRKRWGTLLPEVVGMAEQKEPGAFYGVNVRGADRPAPVGDDRPSGSPRHLESTMNIPNARQVPVEGAVTGPDAPPAHVDKVFAAIDLDDLRRPRI